jgi:hypothetical protein
MNLLKHLIYVLVIQLLVIGPIHAEINSWVDENGIRRYSESPPENPEVPYEVIEEINSEDFPRTNQQAPDDLDQHLLKIKDEEDKAANDNLLKAQKAADLETAKTAYASLRQLHDLAAGDVDWDEYERLLADAKQKLDALAGIPELDNVRALLTDAYDSYAVVPEIRHLENAGRQKSLIALINIMNEKWGTDAPNNYFKARRIFWERGADKLKAAGGML